MRGKSRLKIGLEICFTVSVIWLPPAIMSAMEGEPALKSFLSDCALHTLLPILPVVLIEVPFSAIAEKLAALLIGDEYRSRPRSTAACTTRGNNSPGT